MVFRHAPIPGNGSGNKNMTEQSYRQMRGLQREFRGTQGFTGTLIGAPQVITIFSVKTL